MEGWGLGGKRGGGRRAKQEYTNAPSTNSEAEQVREQTKKESHNLSFKGLGRIA